MRKTRFILGLIAALVPVVSALGVEYADGWPLEDASYFTKVNSWSSAVSVAVLDGQSSDTVHLWRAQISSAPAATPKPRPRPRVGEATPHSEPAAGADAYSTQLTEAMAFVSGLQHAVMEQWNLARDTAEAREWAHEIEAECVLAIDKRTGGVALESLTNSPASPTMASLRRNILNGIGPADKMAKAFTTDAAEMERFRNFIRSFSHAELPAALRNLPGDSVRIRIAFKLAKIGGESDATPAAAVASEKDSSAANPSPRGQEAPNPLDHENVLRHADINDPVYQYAIGFRYYNGDGLERNPVLAVYWFGKAADQGYAPAQAQLALMHQMGMGTERDPAKALVWYRKASAQGNDMAIANIAGMYQNGDGVARDPAEAARWDRKSAEMGHTSGELALGWRYTDGDGVPKDLAVAFGWYLKAALQGASFAQYKLGDMYEHGLGVPADEVEALAWYNLSPTSGLADQTNHRDRLERQLGPDVARQAQRRADDLRKQIASGAPLN
ncbi:MAG TPA: tetratricopeptide repeat protein [Candidatus Didemnitutus sp.]|nr:tetratricopeptide repeat protein [Candidatus Didemnitutus sp.]